MNRPVPILLYHSVSDEAAPKYQPWAISPARFEKHMRFLRESHYTSLTVSQYVNALVKGLHLPKKTVVLTFDDGLADFYTGALPILQQYNLVATLYVTTAYVGGTSKWLTPEGEGQRPMMTWQQIRALHHHGIEVGAHTRTHPQLDLVTTSRARGEIAQSKADLETHLGQPVHSFAYPHGYFSRSVRNLVTQAGYQSACAVKHAMSARTDDRFALARIIVRGDSRLRELAALLAGQGLPVAPKDERLRTKGWRLVRRSRYLLDTYLPKS